MLLLSACAPDYVAPSDYGLPAPSAAPAGDPTIVADATIGCDLSGRWLAVTREVSTGSGAQTAAHEWLYLELAQTGTSITVTKGLSCGHDLVGVSAVSVSGDDAGVWPAMLANCSQTGRGGTSQPTDSQCAVSFDRFYEVIGATVPHYLDPSHRLPAVAEAASAASPGWEDWDDDGDPGYTLNMSGLVTGKLYLASRRWTEWSGAIPEGSRKFTLASDWDSELSVLGYDGSALLSEAASGTKDNDPALHFVTFARLAPSQAVGDDAVVCSEVRSLAPMLAPEATN